MAVLVAIALQVFSGFLVIAQAVPVQVTGDDVLRSLKDQSEAAIRTPSLGRCKLTVVREEHWWPSADEMDSLEEAIKGKPDHPDRAKLAKYQRHRAGQFTIARWSMWLNERGDWRLNEDFAAGPTEPAVYRDSWVVGSESAELLPSSVALYQHTKELPAGRDPTYYGRTAMLDVLAFMHGPLHEKWTFSEATIEDSSRWACIADKVVGKSGLRSTCRLTGLWDAEHGRAVVSRLTVLDDSFPGSKGSSRDYIGYGDLGLGDGRQGYRRVEWRGPDGRLLEVRRLEAMASMTQSEWAAVSRLPSLGGEDAVRGRIAAQKVVDWRSGLQSTIDGAGATVTTALPDMTPSPVRGPLTRQQVAAWLIAAVGVGGLIVLRWRQGRIGKPRGVKS